jgi:hypothetical protein
MPEGLNQCLPWDDTELGPFSVARRSKTTSDWQKHANRVALNIRVVRIIPDAHIRGWDSALDHSRVLHRCRVDYCVRPARSLPS